MNSTNTNTNTADWREGGSSAFLEHLKKVWIKKNLGSDETFEEFKERSVGLERVRMRLSVYRLISKIVGILMVLLGFILIGFSASSLKLTGFFTFFIGFALFLFLPTWLDFKSNSCTKEIDEYNFAVVKFKNFLHDLDPAGNWLSLSTVGVTDRLVGLAFKLLVAERQTLNTRLCVERGNREVMEAIEAEESCRAEFDRVFLLVKSLELVPCLDRCKVFAVARRRGEVI